MRGPKPNYVRNGVRGPMYGPKAGGLTEGTPYPDPPTGTCTGVPIPICVSGLLVHLSSDLSYWLTPQLLYVGSWAAGREPTYFRIEIDAGGPDELISPNLAWNEFWQVVAGCVYSGQYPVDLYAGNACGEDFCSTNIIFQDEDGECVG